jgi:transcriptional regulator with XRE-family HTH domain/uncharacterized coiled-coil protein SlyX
LSVQQAPELRFPRILLRASSAANSRPSHRVTCSQCDKADFVACSGSALPTDMIVKKLKQRGWVIGKSPARDVCPECQAKAVPPLPLMQKQEIVGDAVVALAEARLKRGRRVGGKNIHNKPNGNAAHPLNVWRIAERLTYDEIGEMVGLSGGGVANWVNGKYPMRRQHVDALAALSGVDAEAMIAASSAFAKRPLTINQRVLKRDESIRQAAEEAAETAEQSKQDNNAVADSSTSVPASPFIKLAELQKALTPPVTREELQRAKETAGQAHGRISDLEKARDNLSIRLAALEQADRYGGRTLADEAFHQRLEQVENRAAAAERTLRSLREIITAKKSAQAALEEADARLADWLKD